MGVAGAEAGAYYWRRGRGGLRGKRAGVEGGMGGVVWGGVWIFTGDEMEMEMRVWGLRFGSWTCRIIGRGFFSSFLFGSCHELGECMEFVHILFGGRFWQIWVGERHEL